MRASEGIASEAVVESDPVRAAMARKARQQRGLAIAGLFKVEQVRDHWVVPSSTGKRTYRVTINGTDPSAPLCTCQDHATTGEPCKHVYAVQAVVKDRNQRPAHAPSAEQALKLLDAAKAARPTCRQDWPAYNRAQRSEKPKFQALLADLCAGIEEPPQETGRPRASLRDVVFSAAFKVYSTVSGRRFMGDLAEAERRGHVGRAIHYNTISKYLEMPGLTPILTDLIAESSRPLRAVETDFAADSSGFSTSRFVRWFDHKYGKPVAEYDWVKVSVMTGVKTNIVTAVTVDARHSGDAPQFIPLLAETSRNFKVREVSADSAYASYDNMEAVAAVGGTPYIAFKAGSTGRDGGTFAKMFHYYSFHRSAFLARYHQRSNVESTFSMMKAKFGDSLRSKTGVAMVNEALCKVLCHNLCCLIQSNFELGIESKFWYSQNVNMKIDSNIQKEITFSCPWDWV